MSRLLLGYCSFGILIGFVSGLTDAAITAALLGALFAFIGGGALYFLTKSKDVQQLAGSIMLCFALTCLVGLVIGITVKVHQWLGPAKTLTSKEVNPPGYLHEGQFKSRLDAIKAKHKQIPCEESYQELLSLIEENESGNSTEKWP